MYFRGCNWGYVYGLRQERRNSIAGLMSFLHQPIDVTIGLGRSLAASRELKGDVPFMTLLNSLSPGRCGCNFKHAILWINILKTSCEIANR